MDKRLVAISKFLSKVLRHAPEAIGIELDREGWTDVGTLLIKAKTAGIGLTRETLAAVVAENNKKRFALSKDGGRIRAVQGHSAAGVDIKYEPVAPPPVLFHGTAKRNLAAIFRNGLLPQKRKYVHLSPDADTARSVGARHGHPAVLTVDAAVMHAAGHAFYLADNGVWLAAAVPPRYLACLPAVE